jgi:predicted esterase
MRFLVLIAIAACSNSPSSATPDATGSGSSGSNGGAADAAVVDSTTPVIPTPTGTCPTLAPGDVTFAPAGIPPRKVKLAFDPAKAGHGELIIYWYATGSGTAESGYSLGTTQSAITAAGGIVATPYADSTAGQFEWFIVNGSSKQDDFLVADEVVGCLAQAHLIDTNQIHSMGMSAGALQTTALSFIRASYVASVATYSGGMPPGFSPANQDPENKFAALIFDGGTSDNVFSVDFQAASQAYEAMLKAAGHFAAICDHGKGHAIPLDAAPSVAAFFTANPWGAWPSPYAQGLPPSFPTYCSL